MIFDRVAALGPAIDSASDEVEAGRCLPGPLLDALRDTGVFRMPMPAAWGGPELDPVTQNHILEEIAFHDAAVGWIAMICCDGGYYAGFLDDDATARALFCDLDLMTSGWVVPAGHAELVDGGYRVTGRWQFGSGICHADRVVGGCLLYRDGELVIEDGQPVYRVLFLPREHVGIHDTWSTHGLAGSGSHDYSVNDVFVPTEHAFSPLSVGGRQEPLYRYHGFFFAKLSAVAIGSARRAIAELVDLAGQKIQPPTFQPIANEYRVQVALAEATAALAAARALADHTLGETYATLLAGDDLTLDQRADVGAMMVWVVQTARDIVDSMCAEAGTDSIYRTNRLERIRRDVTTITHHIGGQRKTYQIVGQMRLGIEPSFSIL